MAQNQMLLDDIESAQYFRTSRLEFVAMLLQLYLVWLPVSSIDLKRIVLACYRSL